MNTEIDMMSNEHSFMIAGESSKGKSASLRNIEEPEKWIYLNAEGGKGLPFRSKFHQEVITDPYQVIQAIEYAEDVLPGNTGIIIDSLTFLMDMFETQNIYRSSDSRAGWGDFNQFLKQLIGAVSVYNKPVIFTAHTFSAYDEASLSFKTSIPIKGSLKNNGVEAYFTTVVAAKVMAVKDLKPYLNNGLLTISEEEEELGIKHVFQTRLTKETLGERIRSPMGLFNKSQTFMDNDAQLLLSHIVEFYK